MSFAFGQNAPQAYAAAFEPTLEVIGLIIPGMPVKTNFVAIDATRLKFSLQLAPSDLPGSLLSITEIVVFLLPSTQLPMDHGVLCFWQISAIQTTSPTVSPPVLSATGFELLGALTPARPSGVFPTKWSENDQVIELLSAGNSLLVTIGVSVEPLASVQNLVGSVSDPHASRLFVAERIAADLFRFMQSFDTGAAGSSLMVVPNNIFERWFKRFENKFRRDPSFFLRNDV
jgi:hypothetical protein